ncbi:MAG: hypothetical protein CME62_03965 [Halobacteriovoraceae bacterium]|nr:hypothetical protein [Halobacteriovoraceae bacterium]|tara:strand:- start:16566 stop:17267 length:702 start_codon:yes stop_codon:yes gene_type:complete
MQNYLRGHLYTFSVFVLTIINIEKILNYQIYFSATHSLTSKDMLIKYAASLLSVILLLVSIKLKYRVLPLGSFILLNISMIPFIYGADLFAYALAFYLIFSCSEKHDFISFLGEYLLFGMLVTVYLYNGFYKINDPNWTSGNIMLEIFNSPYNFFNLILSWSVILLQFSITFIYWSKARKVVPLLFCIKHLFIAIYFDLLFGLVCILLHLAVYCSSGEFSKKLKAYIFHTKTP